MPTESLFAGTLVSIREIPTSIWSCSSRVTWIICAFVYLTVTISAYNDSKNYRYETATSEVKIRATIKWEESISHNRPCGQTQLCDRLGGSESGGYRDEQVCALDKRSHLD